MSVAYFSPLPPERSGVADYSALLLPALRHRVDVVVARRGRRLPAADGSLYHVGNDPNAHGWIVAALRRRPGLVVLHEVVLHHLVAGLTLGRGDAAAYLDALAREDGATARKLGEAALAGDEPPLWVVQPERFPLATWVLDDATGVVVHSRYAETRVLELGFRGQVIRVPHPAWAPPRVSPAAVDGGPVIGYFGHLNASKRIPQLLGAFTRLRQRHRAARLLLVGPVSPRFDVRAHLDDLEADDRAAVLHVGYVDEPSLWRYLAAADVCVSLRSPTMGETSGTAVRALSLGRPLVVSDVGWFSELPDDVAWRVAPDEYEVDVLAAALDLLAREPALRAALGRRGADYARTELAVARTADGYAKALGLVREAAEPRAGR